MYECPGVAVINHTNSVASSNRNVFSYSGGQSPKSRCQRGHVPSEGSKGGRFLPLPASGGPRCSLACGRITPIPASVVT